MDPGIQIEQALQEAQKRDGELREQAARVIAHRTEVEMRLGRAVEESAKAREQAGQALRNADAATRAGKAGNTDKWTRAAQALALQMQAKESEVENLKAQHATASEQADLAKRQANENALQLQELAAKRMELVGKLEQAKMQEAVNRTMEQLNRPVDTSGPSLGEIEDKINSRMAQASARAELSSASIEGAQQELERSMRQAEAPMPAREAPRGARPRPGAGRGDAPARERRRRRRPAPAGAPAPAAETPPPAERRLTTARRAPPLASRGGAGASAAACRTARGSRSRQPRVERRRRDLRADRVGEQADCEAAPASVTASSACCAPAPPGVNGRSVASDPTVPAQRRVLPRRVHVAAPRSSSYAEASRKHQPTAWYGHDEHEVAPRRAQDREALADARAEAAHVVADVAGADDADQHGRRSATTSAWSRARATHDHSNAGRLPSCGRCGRRPETVRPADEPARDDEVEHGLREQRRDERRRGRAVDALAHRVDLQDVAAARRRDRVQRRRPRRRPRARCARRRAWRGYAARRMLQPGARAQEAGSRAPGRTREQERPRAGRPPDGR